MEVHFTPQQQARLSKIATQEGIDPEELVKDAALRLIEDDARFRAGVRRGLEQADRGQFHRRRRNGRPRQAHVPTLMRIRWTRQLRWTWSTSKTISPSTTPILRSPPYSSFTKRPLAEGIAAPRLPYIAAYRWSVAIFL
jgi:hypothetical protein